MNRKLHLHPGNFKLSGTRLFRNIMMIILSQDRMHQSYQRERKIVLRLSALSS